MTKTIAVLLSGSGVYDGSEIHETVLTLLAIQSQGAQYQCFAPNIEQMHVINHRTGTATSETRNVLAESARIARGDVEPLNSYRAENFDALFLPGGFGAAKNLCNFALEGANCTVQVEVERALRETHLTRTPIAAMCIAPVILAKLFPGVTITLGGENDASTAATAMGATIQHATHGEVVIDADNKIVTTPTYMLDDANIMHVHEGSARLIQALFEMMS